MPFAGASWWENILVLLLMFGLPIGIIWVIVQWVKFFSKKNEKSALDIAKERYARGEISKAELKEIRENLR
jgi:uncharacterized membrane protein